MAPHVMCMGWGWDPRPQTHLPLPKVDLGINSSREELVLPTASSSLNFPTSQALIRGPPALSPEFSLIPTPGAETRGPTFCPWGHFQVPFVT